MIDHIYLPVTDIDRSLQFYTALLTPLDFAGRWDFKGQDGWPDLYGFGGDRPRFWLKRSTTTFPELYVAFIATSKEAVEKAYAAALANGGADNGAPGPRPKFSDRYYAANVLDPDGYSLEICFKPWLYDGSDPVSSRAQRQPTEGDDMRAAPPTQQQPGGDMAEIRPFRVEVHDAAIDDLRERLARTRWPEKEPVDDWSMGIPLAYVQELAGYWAKSYDMRRVADRLNRYKQFMTTIDGVGIHFLHVRSPVAGATPCVMTHGWPGSVIEFIKVIDPLVDPVGHGGEASDALELVIPSLPGYGWSGKPTVTGWNVEKIAQAWIELMDRLGYERWVAQGGDWGAIVSSAIGRLADPAKLIGIHFNWAVADPAKLTELGGPNEEEQRYLARLRDSSEIEGGYLVEQATKPQTLGYGLTDSPAGQLAWIVEKFKTWSDCGDDLESSFTKDELLDNVMVYWLNAAATSSARLYWHSLASSLASFDEVPAPSAYSRFPADNVALSERWARTRFTDLRYYGTPKRGGHFAACEAPGQFVAEVRAGLRALI